MTGKNLIPSFQDIEYDTTSESISDTSISEFYEDNLTAKLGGNYVKIIEFYDSKL